MTTTAPEDRVERQLDRARDLGTEVTHLTRTMQVIKTSVASQAGVPWSTYVLLFHLIAGGPQRSRSLADAACTDPSTVSRQVDVLVRLGLAERTADPDDGRATLLVATPAGVAQQQRMRDARDQMLAGVLDDWSDDDVAVLTGLLARFNGGLAAGMGPIVSVLQQRLAVADPTSAPPAQRTTPTPEDDA